MEALEQVLLRVSEMVCELPQLREMDINPIIVDETGAVAVDARIVIDARRRRRRRPTTATTTWRSCPTRRATSSVWPLRGGGEYTVRPIHPDDAQMLQALVRGLSPESRYFRFVSSMHELPARDAGALHADRLRPRDGAGGGGQGAPRRRRTARSAETERIVGVSRYITNPDQTSCEFSLVVADDFNGKGLGSRLMQSIMDVAREKGLTEIDGLVLANNPACSS